MKLSNKGAAEFDRYCYTIYDFPISKCNTKTEIKCSKCGHNLHVCYCESKLYVVECVHCGIKCLVKASNPKEACSKTLFCPNIEEETMK